jgi:hypothetical protein
MRVHGSSEAGLLDTRLQYVYLVLLPTAVFLIWLWVPSMVPGLVYFCAGLSFLYSNILFWDAATRLKTLYRNADSAPSDQASYFLFLRSFTELEGYQTTGVAVGTDGVNTQHVESDVWRIDDAVGRQRSRLVVLGGHLILSRSHQVIWLRCPDHEWEKNFRVLARHARGIILSPEVSRSLLDEVRFLRDHELLGKTIVLMPVTPPTVSGLVHYDPPDRKKERWDIVRTELQEDGLTLPAYEEQGKLLLLSGDCRVEGSVDLFDEEKRRRLPWWRKWATPARQADYADALAVLLEGWELRGAPFAEVYPLLHLSPRQVEHALLTQVPGSDGLWGTALGLQVMGVVVIGLLMTALAFLLGL